MKASLHRTQRAANWGRDGTRSVPRTKPAKGLRGLFGELFEVVVETVGARHERRLQALRDRLLRDDALRHVGPGGELEHDVEEGGLDDGAEAARAGLAGECMVGDLPERVLGEDELDVVVAEEALVLLRQRVLG